MANPAVKKSVVNLDREREIRLSLNTMVRFEDLTGVKIMSGLDTGNMAVKDVRTLLWLCLEHEDKELTQEQVGEMIHMGNLSEVTSALAAAVGVKSSSAAGGAKEDNGDPMNHPVG